MRRDCEIITSQQLTETTYAITMEAGEIAQRAAPGQFIHIRCGEERLLRRPISICDVSGDHLIILFDVTGVGTRWLANRKSGVLDVLGPLGNGFRPEGRHVLAVGGGIGVPPLLLAAKKASGRVSAVLGFQTAGRIILADHFRQVCEETHITTDDGSYGEAGFVTAPLERCLESGAFDQVMSCGPRAMLRAVAMLSERYQVPCQVSLEERMGCGVGACLVCACRVRENGTERYGHVCKDGPVFNAAEVVWDA